MIEQLIEKYEKELKELDECGTGYVAYYGEKKKCKEILQDLKQLKEKVAEELYGQMLSESEHKGACERLIGNNDTPIKEIGD